MIVEFTGPTGSGKSTCLAQVADRLALLGIAVGVIGHDVNRIRGIPDVFASLEAHNWKTDVMALPWACVLLAEYPRYAWFVLRAVLGLSSHRLVVVRAVIRKMGIYRFLSRRRFRDLVVLVDEGILHVGHNILVSPTDRAIDGAARVFAELSPVPTLVIILTAPPEVLVARLRERGDLSPRIRSGVDLHNFTRIAACFFNIVTSQLSKRTNSLHFDTTLIVGAEVAALITEKICEMFIAREASSMRRRVPRQPKDNIIE